MICGRNTASNGRSAPMSRPEPADSRCTSSGPRACRICSGWTGSFGPVDSQESTWAPSPPSRSLATNPIQAALLLDGGLQAAEGHRRVDTARRCASAAQTRCRLAQVVHGAPPGVTSGYPGARGYAGHCVASPASGTVQSHVRSRFKQAPSGQVQVDRRDRDPPVDDRVEIRARAPPAPTAADRRSRSRGCRADPVRSMSWSW